MWVLLTLLTPREYLTKRAQKKCVFDTVDVFCFPACLSGTAKQLLRPIGGCAFGIYFFHLIFVL